MIKRSWSLLLVLVILTAAVTACTKPLSSTTSTKPLTWDLVGTGDCTGLDEGGTTEGSIPDDSKAQAGYTAVCWDGMTYNNVFNPGRAFCTYKKIAYDKCTGGENIGEMYTARP